MKIIFVSLLTFILANMSVLAAELATVNCHVSLEKDNVIHGVQYVHQTLKKKVRVKSNLFGGVKRVNFEQTINFDFETSVTVNLSEVFDQRSGHSKVVLSGVLARHRAGNGKVVLGEHSRTIEIDTHNIGSVIDLDVFNTVDNINDLINYDKGVVNKAFIECSTL